MLRRRGVWAKVPAVLAAPAALASQLAQTAAKPAAERITITVGAEETLWPWVWANNDWQRVVVGGRGWEEVKQMAAAMPRLAVWVSEHDTAWASAFLTQ